MTQFQKIIKYVAISFAFFLIFSVFSFVVLIFSSIATISEEESTEISQEFQNDYYQFNIELKNLNQKKMNKKIQHIIINGGW